MRQWQLATILNEQGKNIYWLSITLCYDFETITVELGVSSQAKKKKNYKEHNQRKTPRHLGKIIWESGFKVIIVPRLF